jgi:GT2 family glycosyltransferase
MNSPRVSIYPKISIIVAVYNAAKTLENCMRSLLALDYPQLRREIIAIDNNSSDRSLEILQQFTASIRILQEPIRGAAAARNRGVMESQHPFIVFTDADCRVAQDWLKQLIKPLQEQDGVAAAGGRILTQQPANLIARFSDHLHNHNTTISENPPYLITMNMAIRRAAFIDIGLFDTQMLRAEDTDLSYRLHFAGHNFVYARDAIVYHQNPSSLNALFKKGYQHGFWNVKLAKKHQCLIFSMHKRIDRYGYMRIIRAAKKFVLKSWQYKQWAIIELCQFVFDSGKKLGMLCGSIRFWFFYI